MLADLVPSSPTFFDDDASCAAAVVFCTVLSMDLRKSLVNKEAALTTASTGACVVEEEGDTDVSTASAFSSSSYVGGRGRLINATGLDGLVAAAAVTVVFTAPWRDDTNDKLIRGTIGETGADACCC